MPPGSRPTRRGRGEHADLSRDLVLREALALLDEAGSSALTMRALGRRLGVEAMSLYHYVGSREELLDGVAEVLVEGIPAPDPVLGWRDAVHRFASSIRQVALHHPDAFQLVGMRPLSAAAAARAVAPLLHALRRAGLTPEQSTVVYRLLAAYARGFGLAEIAGLTLADPPLEQVARDSSARDLVDFADALGTDHDRIFEQGLGVVVDGVRTRFGLPAE